MIIPLKRVNHRDAQDADQMMPSILFPPLLSLDSSGKDYGETSSIPSPSKGGGGISCGEVTHDPRSFQLIDQDVHDCLLPRPCSESHRYSQLMSEATTRMSHSQSMPSFEHIALKMSEKKNMDDDVAAAPEMTAAYDDTNNTVTSASVAAEGGLDHEVPFPTYIPKLRIRRISSDMDLKLMPSPLARRGGNEMKYLQKQLKAEAFIRRKQQQHNEERNKRRGDKNDDDFDALEDEDTFANAPFHWRRRSRTNNTIMDLAASPPIILKNSFKRTVSETLKDSGIPEDANLLFTPMGKPLIDDADVATDKNHEENTILGKEGESSHEKEEIFTMDGNGIRISQDEFLVTEEGGFGGGMTLPLNDEDVEDDLELSPSLMPSGIHYELADSPPHELRSNSPTNAYKKITLRPKMKVRTDSCDFATQLGTSLYKSTEVSTSYGNEPTSTDDKMEKTDLTCTDREECTLPQKSRFGRLAAQRFLNTGSESFDALTFEDRAAINSDTMYSITRVKTDGPDTSDRLGASPSFSESNYATPDNSFSSRHSVRANKLWSMIEAPELPLATSPFPEQNFYTPGSSQSRRHRERMGLPNQLPAAPLFGGAIEEEITGFLPSEASPDPKVDTPQDLLFQTACKNLLSIQQFAELVVVPQPGSPTKPQEVGATPTNEEKKEIDEEELRDHIKSPQ
ncbi:hypothetical protein ACHAXM_009543 [Skeletonema potamos]